MQSYKLEIWDSVEQQWKHLVSCNSTSYNVQVSVLSQHGSVKGPFEGSVKCLFVSRTSSQIGSTSFVSGQRTSTESESRAPNLNL